MAQDVALWGVAYADVPEVRVPKQGGGMAAFHDVSDTTAQAADVAQGKLFHAADGTLTEGTASGGGGASNVFSGSFTTENNAGYYTLSLPYSGTGYPVRGVITIEGGPSVGRNNVGTNNVLVYSFAKAYESLSPDYDGAGNEDYSFAASSRKTSSSTSWTTTAVYLYSSEDPTYTASGHTKIKNATTLKFYVAKGSNAYMMGTTYNYVIEYSS